MATFGLAVVAAMVAVVAAVALVLGRDWLGQRALWGAGLVVVSLVALWWRPRGEAGAVWASVFMVVGGAVIATDLSSAADHDFDQRVLADDLPPVAVYVAAIGLGVSAVAAAVVAALRPGAGPLRSLSPLRSLGSRRRAGTVAGISGVAAVVLMAAVVPVGAAIRSAADRRAEADDLTVSLTTPVERRADTPGPGRPSRRAWSAETAPHPTGSVAVPGWDVVLVVSRGRPFWLTAVAASDGEELWTHRREGAGGVRATVDPEAGRILLTDGNAAVVLDLADGSEVVTRRLPHPGACGPVRLDDVEVSPWAPLDCRDDGDRWVSLVEVSSGRSRASTDPLGGDDRPGDRWSCETTVAPGAAPVVAQTGGGDCRSPEIVASDPGSDDFRMPAPLEPPPAWSDLDRPPRTYTSELRSVPIATDDVVVLALFWLLGDEDPDASHLPLEARGASEVVALDRHGDVLWRRPDVHAAPTVTDHGVLVRALDEWQLLSLADGAVAARDSQAEDEEDRIGGEPVVTTDGERLYTLAGADLVVRDLADLTVREIRQDVVPDRTRHVHAAGGRLIFRTADASLVAYEDAQER